MRTAGTRLRRHSLSRSWESVGARAIATLLSTFLAIPSLAQALHDDRGAAIHMAAPPQRIVSLLPSLTESICALGACDRLVGTDRFSNWPASVAALPKLGGLEDAQIERIAALKPDLVVASTSARVTDRLEALGLQVVVLDSRTREDVHRSLTLLARLLATPIPAERLWADIERETRGAAERVPPALRGQRVYFEIDSTPYAAGPTSFVGETLQRIGMSNAISAELGPFPKLNPEYVVRLQPDIVMSVQRELQAMAGRPGWSTLKALLNRRTCGFSSERYELLVRPGPRMGEAANVFADCLIEIARNR